MCGPRTGKLGTGKDPPGTWTVGKSTKDEGIADLYGRGLCLSTPTPRPEGLCKWLLSTLWVQRVGVQCKAANLGDQLSKRRNRPSHLEQLLWVPFLSGWRQLSFNPRRPQQSVTIRKYPGHTFISRGEKKKNAKKSAWGSESAVKSGQFKGEENWRISLVNFTSFRSISFNFIPFHPAPGGPRPQGGGGVFPDRIYPILQIYFLWLRTALILKR